MTNSHNNPAKKHEITAKVKTKHTRLNNFLQKVGKILNMQGMVNHK
jgi:hypothetical protein